MEAWTAQWSLFKVTLTQTFAFQFKRYGNHKIEFQLENFCVRQYKFPVDAVVS